MMAELTELKHKLELLEQYFGHTAYTMFVTSYNITFPDSTLITHITILKTMPQDDIVKIILELYEFLIQSYLSINSLQQLPPKLKKYELTRFLNNYIATHSESNIETKVNDIHKALFIPLKASNTPSKEELISQYSANILLQDAKKRLKN